MEELGTKWLKAFHFPTSLQRHFDVQVRRQVLVEFPGLAPLVQDADEEDIMILVRKSKWSTHAHGTSIVNAGDPCQDLILPVHGKLSVPRAFELTWIAEHS